MQAVTDATFDKEVLKSEKTVLVDCWAEWCGPCKLMGPVFEELSKDLTKAKFVKLDVDANGQTAGRYNVMSIPTILAFKNGKETGRLVGFQPKPALKKAIEAMI